MISVITAVHNQLEMNRIFWEFLSKNTHHPFELIVIDNASTDGSADFFESVGARVIRNQQNFSYPVTQNQGVRLASFDVFAFLNNDIIVGKNWDKILLRTMEYHGLDIATPAGIEKVETASETRRLNRRWNRIRNGLGWLGFRRLNLLRMWSWMYGNWEEFCASREERFGNQVLEGFVGNSVVMTRKGYEKAGEWDERIQGADWDLYIRSKKRAALYGDIKPVHVVLAAFNHHYVRLTAKSRPAPFADLANIITLEEKWGEERLQYLKDLPF